MTWLPRPPFVASELEQAFWLASLAVCVDSGKRDRVVAAVIEMLLERRAKARA